MELRGLPSGLLAELSSEVLERVGRILLPRRIDGSVARAYIRKAVRAGAWRSLRAESRALLRAVSAWRGAVRSRALEGILRETLLTIELGTLRGRALLCGVYLALRGGLSSLLGSAERLLCLGLSYLSNPPIFRVLG